MKRFCITLLFSWFLILHIFSQECIDYTDLYAPNVTATYGSTSNPYANVGVVLGQHTVMASQQLDPCSTVDAPLYTTPAPDVPSVRLGNASVGAKAESITYGFDVPVEGTLLLLQYAVVLQDPNHTEVQQPRFIMRITDDNGNSLDATCLDADFIPGKNTSNWIEGKDKVRYKNWSTLGINLLNYGGTHINITFTTYDCTRTAHFGYAYFTLSCQSGEIDVVSCGDDATVDLVAPDGFNYEWYRSPSKVVISTDRVLTVPFNDASTYVCHAINKEISSCYFPISATAEKRDPIANGYIYSCGRTIMCSEMTTIQATTPSGIVTDMKKSCETFFWEFGDGATSTEAHPIHTYAQDGDYIVTLHAGIHGKRCVDTWTQKVTVKTQYSEILAICEQELPYHWRDTVFQKGTINDTFIFKRKNEANCDSIVTLKLTVYPKYHQQEAAIICANDLPYDWRDTTFEKGTSSGQYVFHRSSIYGCDSIVTLDLTVNPSYEHTFSLELCEDDLPTVWNGNVLERDYTTKTYTFNKKTILGCDSIVHLNLTVHPCYNKTVNMSVCPSEFPAVLCDSIFDVGTTSGQYLIHLSSEYGCDSIITLNLKVLPSFDYSVSQAICENELPYTWRDTIFEKGTLGSTYHFKKKTVHGCDSIVHLNLTVHPSYEQTFSLELCEDELPTIWNGNPLNKTHTTGTYTFPKKTIYGCDSIVHLNLTVHPCYTKTVNMTLCPHEFPIMLCDSIFDVGTTSGPYMFRFSSEHGCDSIVTLNLKVLPSFDYTIPLGVCENDLPYIWRDTTFEKGTLGGTYHFKKKTVHGCDSIVHLNLTIYPSYYENVTLEICQNDLPYVWKGHVLDENTQSNTFTYSYKTENGCDSIQILNLIVHPQYNQKERMRICPHELPFAWRDTIFYAGTTSRQYVFHRSTIHGCDSIVTLDLTVLPNFDYSVSQVLCESDLPYEWHDTIFEKGTSSGTYLFNHQTVHGCDSIVRLNLTVHPSYEQTFSLELCEDELPTFWNGNPLNKTHTTGTYTFKKKTIHGCDSIIHLNLTVHPCYNEKVNMMMCPHEFPTVLCDSIFDIGTRSGQYVFHFSSVNGCDSVVTLNLTVLPSFNYTVEEGVCDNELPYIWRDTIFAKGTLSGMYHFKKKTVNGCDSIVHLNLTVYPSYYENVTREICQNDLPYVWKGHIFDEDTRTNTFTYSYTTANGCDSIQNFNLIVHENVSITENRVICSSELPYHWRDTTFGVGTKTNTFVFKKQTIHKSDSIVTLNLTVHPSYRDTVELMLCQNELPYIWRDTVFGRGTMSGYYTLYDSSIYGCDSITVVHLRVNQTYNENEELILCHSDLPYKWRSKIIDKSMTDGIYTFHEKTIYGCDSIVTLRLEIRPPKNTEEEATVCRSSLPMEWRDTVFANNARSGVYSIYREDQYGCINKHTLTLTVKDTSIVHFYDSIYVDSVYTDHNFYYVAPRGLDEIVLEQHHTNHVMCDSSVFLHLEILEPPFVALLDIPNVCADQNICEFAISYSNLRFYPDKITVTFDEYAKQAGFVDYVSTKIKGYTMISVPKNVIPDIYHGTITFTTDHFTQKTDIELMIQYPASIIEQHWNDVLALRDETLNGGFYFEEFQWYRNGSPIIAETESFLYVGPNEELDMNAEYQVLIRRVGEEKKIFTCPLIPVYHFDTQEYPTIAGRSEVLKMPISVPTSFTFYSVLGDVIMQTNLTPDNNEMIAPNSNGVFIVRVIDAEDQSFTYKMMVK